MRITLFCIALFCVSSCSTRDPIQIQPSAYFICGSEDGAAASIYFTFKRSTFQPNEMAFDFDRTGKAEVVCVISAASLTCESLFDFDEDGFADTEASYNMTGEAVIRSDSKQRVKIPEQFSSQQLAASYEIAAQGFPHISSIAASSQKSEYFICRGIISLKHSGASLWLVFERKNDSLDLVGRFVCAVIDRDGDGDIDTVIGFADAGVCVAYVDKDQDGVFESIVVPDSAAKLGQLKTLSNTEESIKSAVVEILFESGRPGHGVTGRGDRE